ncbi:MAG: hypothetical protein ACI8YQ_003081 [Polaribacter sp.]|jgi:hypothetical protein
MKKILKTTMLMLACLFIVGVTDVDAQYGKKKKKKKKVEKVEEADNDDYFDESGGKFIDKLWYGSGLTLGFAGGNNESVFTIGISPMVGYKLTDRFSVGPRVVLDYTLYKTNQVSNSVQRVDLVTYGLGFFGRAKIFQSLFAHAEYAILSQAFPAQSGNDLVTFRQNTNNFYIGGGYHSGGGGGLGYEIVLLYNTLEPDDSIDLPIDFRVGFTWGF